MTNWIEFEIECTNYLNKRFGAYAHFIHQGGADSTVPDILVESNHGNSFYIDAKHSPAQCGQFVLFPNISSRTFEYSKQNANRINIYAEKIIEHMNQQFDEFRNAGTAGKDIIMENDSYIFSNWIIQTYKEKGTEFFITNNHTLLPIERFHEYFDVSAKYRIKRSGSGNVGKSRLTSVLNYIESHDYAITDSHIEDDKLFVTSNRSLHNLRFILEKYEYMFSQRDTEYEIRKLSNTYNANVIFSIKQNDDIPGLSDDDFIDSLK